MIDPTKITNFNANMYELEEMLLFWICAAGKNGVTAAKNLDKLLKTLATDFPNLSPFQLIQSVCDRADFPSLLKKHGIGCYNFKARSFCALVHSGLDLKKCSVDQLEELPGIGPKTARCFLIHSRPNQRFAGLDTHVLKFLRDIGHDVPKHTPTGKKYKQIEEVFLNYCDKLNFEPSKLDLLIWNHYRNLRKKDI